MGSAKLALTDKYLKKLKATALKAKAEAKRTEAPKAKVKRIEVPDSVSRGLIFRCSPSGVTTWSYVYKAKGKMRRVTLGEFPAVGLKAARALADASRAQRRAGDDPLAVQAEVKAQKARDGLTVDELTDQFTEKYLKPNHIRWKSSVSLLKPFRAALGKRLAPSLRRADIITFLEDLVPRGVATTNRTQGVVRTMWGWAADRELVPANIMAGMKKVGGKEQHKNRVLTADEIRAFWKSLDDADIRTTESVRLALKTILLTAQRPGEVAGTMLSELHDLDSQNPLWIIPAIRTKNKLNEHAVPLNAMAVRLIKLALERDAEDDATDDEERGNDRAVFASRFENIETIARHSLSQAVRRIVLDDGLTRFTPHDLRRTAATLAQAGGVHKEHVGALLNHTDETVTAIYARHHLMPEKRNAVKVIERQVAAILGVKEGKRPRTRQAPEPRVAREQPRK